MGDCELCGGPLGVLGVLGKLTWLVCRNCGMQFSTEAEIDFDDGDDDLGDDDQD